jgi:SAM-dependent methyltransferase
MAVQEIDRARAEAFAGRAFGIVNDAWLTLSLSVGHRLGIYDAMAELGPATTDDLAGRAGVQERYVREWLAAQLAGGIVEHDAEAGTWTLPPEHAAFLTSAAGPNDVSLLASGLHFFGELEDDVVTAFRDGGGVPWKRMERLQVWQSELSYGIYHSALDAILGFAPGLVDRLRSGIDVVDVGCGRGHAALRIADAYPASRVTGYDQASPAIADATAEAERANLDNVSFEVRDAAALAAASADLVLAFDVIHDLARPYEALASIRKALRPGGVFLMAEHALSHDPDENVHHPFGAALYTVSLFHCMTASLSQDGEGLGLAWGEERIRPALAEAGFTTVERNGLEGDPLNAYYVARVD